MHFDVFNDDAFSLASLTASINDQPHLPGRLGQLGLFQERGISTTMVSVEAKGKTLSLVASAQRGASGAVYDKRKRTMRNFSAVHLPQRATISADEIQNLRAFGSETEAATMAGEVAERLGDMRSDIDATLEFHRIGALKGQVLDADGSTVLLDLFTEFGVAQQTMSFELDVATTKVRTEGCLTLKRLIEDELGGLGYTGIRVLCSEGFFDSLIDHADVKAAYERWQAGEALRDDPRGGFKFGGIIFEEYRGTVGGTDFIPADAAYAVPEGVRGLFIARYAPADYMETVNTMGVPYYAKQEPVAFNKGIELEAQSNPVHLCTRPRAVVKLTKT